MKKSYGGSHSSKTVIEPTCKDVKLRNYSGHLIPSGKLEDFTERHLKELFDDGKIREGVLMVGYSAKKGYGTELRNKWVDNIIIAQSKKDMLNLYVAKLDEVKRLCVSSFASPNRMLLVKVYWIKAGGKAELLFENDGWLSRANVSRVFDRVAEFKGYKPTEIPLALKKIAIQREIFSTIIINVWQKAYIDNNGKIHNLICQIEAGALLDVEDCMIDVKNEYELASKQEVVASRFMLFEISNEILRKCGE